MKVRRVEYFNLPNRPLFSAIYGPGVKDDYVGSDLRRYGIWETLFLTFRSQGYNVVFYSQDPSRNFFSFRKDDLVELFGLKRNSTSTTKGGRYVANIKSPFGNRRKQSKRCRQMIPKHIVRYRRVTKAPAERISGLQILLNHSQP